MKSRFPALKKVDGKIVCRGCGGAIPKGRRTWCNLFCKKQHDPFYVIQAVKNRDKGICQLCGILTGIGHRRWGLVGPSLPKPEYDHIIPFSEGGPTSPENMRTLCRPCHVMVTRLWRQAKAAKRKLQACVHLNE